MKNKKNYKISRTLVVLPFSFVQRVTPVINICKKKIKNQKSKILAWRFNLIVLGSLKLRYLVLLASLSSLTIILADLLLL